MTIIKKKSLKIIIIASFIFNIANINTFTAKEVLKAPTKIIQKSIDWIKKNKEIFMGGSMGTFTISAFITLTAMVLVGRQKAFRDKILRDTCIYCNKLNNYCECQLSEKIEYVFKKYNITETTKYVNNVYSGTYYSWKPKKIKSVLSKINDINAKLTQGHTLNGLTPLYIACSFGNMPIIKWLVEDMFADINIKSANGIYPSEILKGLVSYCRSKSFSIDKHANSIEDFLASEIDLLFLEKKALLQQELLDHLEGAKNIVIDRKSRQYEELISYNVGEKLYKAKKLIYSKKTPGFAKQLSMPILVFIHETYPECITEKEIKTLYKYIAFNYTFLNDARFEKAVEFAKDKKLQDIYGRTVSQAYKIYDETNKNSKC